MLSRLNGWQRLWMLCSGIYLLLVVFFLITELRSDVEQTSSVATELRELIELATEAKDQETIVAANKKLELLRDTTNYDRLKSISKYSLIWVLPVTLAYLFGAAVGWVIKGFKKAGGS